MMKNINLTKIKRLKRTILLPERMIVAHELLSAHVHIGIRRKKEFFNPNISSQFLFESECLILYNVHFVVMALRRSLTIAYTRFYARHPLLFFMNQKRFTTYLASLAANKFVICNFWPGGMLTNYRTIFRRYIQLNKSELAGGKLVKTLSPTSRKSILNIHTVIPRIPAALISFSGNHLPINDANSLGIFSLSFFNLHDVAAPPSTIAVAANMTNPVIFTVFRLLTETFYDARLLEKKYFFSSNQYKIMMQTDLPSVEAKSEKSS
jgi:hypothetical protein